MTWSAWVNISGNPANDGQIIARSDNASGWQLKISPDTGKRTFAIAISGTSSSGHTQRYSNTVYSFNIWYYVTGVYNSSARTLDIYVNGALDNGVLVGAVPGLQYVPAVNVNIGRRPLGYYFKGIIDDVSVYNRALSPAEIQDNMNTGVTGSSVVTTSALKPAVQGPTELSSSEGPLSQKRPSSLVARTSVSGLSCSPRSVNAGGQVSCELRVSGAGLAADIQLLSDSSQVRIPAVVVTRDNQSRLTFKGSVDLAAKRQAVTMTAILDGTSVQDTVLVTPSSAPILTLPDRQFARFGSPLSFQVTGVDPLDSPVRLLAADLPAGATFDPLSARFDWTPGSSQAGKHEVTFKAINGIGQSSTAQVLIDVDSGAPVLTGSGACSPGAIGTLRGKWLVKDGNELADPSGKSLVLGGTGVAVNGEPVPTIFVSSTRVSFICPTLEPGTQLSVSVVAASEASGPLTIPMQTVSPAIFSLEGGVPDQGVISFSGIADIAIERNAAIAGHPAQPGDELLIWGTGFGSAAETSTRQVSVTLGDSDAEVEAVRAVPGYAGMYTIQVRVPAATMTGSAVPVEVQVTTPDGKQIQSNHVRVAVESLSH
jgi:uncharacterized protein (TIGR03437 family)